ncbi:MAG: hypothetical protein CMG50_05320, partial [Candidatus Marinimicrobia bacterium]|nr:hypothetical protein [Candidatus Neomarinimicrobiota bacterium]
MTFNKLIYFLFFSFMYSAIIVGTVKDEDGNPIIYANVYLKDTFDGTSSDDKGSFAFETYETGNQTLIISFIGYESYEKEYNIDENLTLDIILKQLITRADEVVITAGSFGASDDEKVIVLDPIDIVTVASSRGEISGALEALPGTQPQADKEGVYVRGGDATEAKQIVDGMLIQNPYFSDVPDIPQRGRFEPFDFQGTAFSQGGYSAQYGQALSAIVDLKTWTRFGDFNANTFGITPLSVGYGRGYGNDSTACGINIDYSNIEYFQNFNNSSNFIKSRVDFTSPPEGLEIKTNYAKKFKNGIYKYIGRITDYSLGTKEADIGSGFNLDNKNLFLLSTYRGKINKNWRAQFGISYSENSNDSEIISEDFIDPLDIDSYDDLFQLRTVFTKKFLGRSKINFGIHLFDQSSEFINYTYEFDDNDEFSFDPPNLVMIDEFLSTAFTELDLRLFKNFAINAGIRYENSKLLDKSSFSPRFSSAIKVTKNSQISYAYGVYYQTPDMGFDQWYRQNNIDIDFNNSGLDFEKSIHNILNYEWSKKKKTIRFEIFNKKYENLVVSNSIDIDCVNGCKNNLSNEGFGYSRGAELFWRSNQTIDGIGKDIWIAYSYLDSKRKFKQFSNEIIPSFASNHKLTFIYKNAFKLKNGDGFNTSLAITGTSGYPYYDPFNNEQFESDPYLSFDIGGSYLPQVDDGFMVVFFNISNPFGYRNSFGYNFVDFDST